MHQDMEMLTHHANKFTHITVECPDRDLVIYFSFRYVHHIRDETQEVIC